MEYRYKIVIIGAGPAGASCALSLQKRGEEPCLIDEAVFPRHKTCAGLVTEKTYRLIKDLYPSDTIDALFCDASSKLKLFRRSEELVSAKLKRPVRFVDRNHFDNALVGEYKTAGGVIREGEREYQIDLDHHRIIMKNGDEIAFDYLVFADGALSRSHKGLHVDKRKLAFGIEAYIPKERFITYSVDLYFDYLKNGYVWAFPHGDTVCIGAANLYDPRLDYHELFTSILMDIGVKDTQVKRHGAFLPYGYIIPQEKLPDNVLLIGDAGGFTDPISGEGLYMSMKTGISAANALLTDAPKQAYLSDVKPLIEIVKEGKKACDAFYSPLVQKLFFRKVRDNEKAVCFFFEKMVHEYSYDYSQMPQLFRDYKRA